MTEKTFGRCRCIDRPTSGLIKGEIYVYEKHRSYVKISSIDGLFLSNIIAFLFDSYFIDLGEEREVKLSSILYEKV